MNPICPGDLVRIKKDFVKHLPVSADDNCWRSPMLVISVSPDRSDSFENDILQNNKRLIFLMLATGRNVLIIEDYLEIISKGAKNVSVG